MNSIATSTTCGPLPSRYSAGGALVADESPRREGVSMKLVAILGASLATVLGILSTVLVLLVKSFVAQMEIQHKDNIAQMTTQHADNMTSQRETREVLKELAEKQQTLSETLRSAYQLPTRQRKKVTP